MFHLDDDSKVAILSFADPFSLTSYEATSRHSRRLVKMAWNVHDKNLTKTQREGGATSRQRVLSSFAVHKSSVMSRLSQLIEDSSWSDLNKRGINILPWDQLDGSKHLVHLRISGLTSSRNTPFQTYCETTIAVSSDQISSMGNTHLARVPLTRDQFGSDGGADDSNEMAGLLDSLYGTTGAAENSSFHPESRMQSCKCIDSLNRRLDAISIVAFDRQTLAPSVMFKEDDTSGGSTRTILTCIMRDDGYLSITADIQRPMYGHFEAGDASFLMRSVCLYFRRDSFGLALSHTGGADIGAAH